MQIPPGARQVGELSEGARWVPPVGELFIVLADCCHVRMWAFSRKLINGDSNIKTFKKMFPVNLNIKMKTYMSQTYQSVSQVRCSACEFAPSS